MWISFVVSWVLDEESGYICINCHISYDSVHSYIHIYIYMVYIIYIYTLSINVYISETSLIRLNGSMNH